MPFSIRLEPETGILIATCAGSLDLGDAEQGVRAVWENPEWSGKPILWDFREARLDFTTPDVRQLAQWVLEGQPSTPPARVAFVTARDVDFGLVRMFEVFREHPATEVRVFRDYGDAVFWVRGVGPTSPKPPTGPRST